MHPEERSTWGRKLLWELGEREIAHLCIKHHPVDPHYKEPEGIAVITLLTQTRLIDHFLFCWLISLVYVQPWTNEALLACSTVITDFFPVRFRIFLIQKTMDIPEWPKKREKSWPQAGLCERNFTFLVLTINYFFKLKALLKKAH